MRINLKKRFTALMLAGMMVTSNVLPAYSATDGIAVEQADASYEAAATAADTAADAENSEAGGASSEQDDTGKPVADAVDSDSTTDASANAGDESHVADAAAGSASSTSASDNAGAGSAAAGEQTTANKSEATSGTATEETKSDAANGTATEESKSDATNGTVIEESKADAANGTVTDESKSDAANGTGAEESKADAVHGSNAGGSTVVGAGSVGIGESTGAAVEIEETKPEELLEEETKLATESEIPKEEDEKKLEEKENRKTIYIAFGKGVKVTATLEDANAVPDDARLRVTDIEDGELYDAYIAAMDEAEPEIKHTKDNTDIRDIAFIMKDEDGEETEYEPTEGSVKVAIEYLGNNLKKRLGVDDIADVKTYHLPLAEGVKAEGEKTIDVQNVKASDINVQELDSDVKTEKKVEVEVDSFSAVVMARRRLAKASEKTSTDLSKFLTGLEITGDGVQTNEDGSYTIKPDSPYTFKLNFAEVDRHDGLQFDDDGPLTYNLPNGLYDISASGDCEIIAKDEGGNEHKVPGNHWEISKDVLTFNWNKTDENFELIKKASNTKFNLSVQAKVSQSVTVLKWSGKKDISVKIDSTNRVSVVKNGTVDLTNDKINYTVTVTSEGNNTNVVVKDTITGTALTYNNDAAFTSNKGSVAPTGGKDGNGFSYTIPSMVHGEIITINYSAKIDSSKISDNGTIEQTGNKISVHSDEQPSPSESTKNFEHQIDYKPSLKKDNGYPGTVVKGYRTVPYTVTYNEDCRTSVAGHTITDKFADGSKERMSYAGDVKIKVYDADGRQVGDVRTLSPAENAKEWSYTIPDEDKGKKYKYVFEYNVNVDVKGLVDTTTVTNTVSDGSKPVNHDVSVEPGAGEKAGVTKKAIKVTSKEIKWEITLTVPASGLKKAEVIDTLPNATAWVDHLSENKTYYDTYESFETINDQKATDKEPEVKTEDGGKKVHITFGNGLKGTGAERKVKIILTTKTNEDWVKLVSDAKYKDKYKYITAHINNLIFKANDVEFKASGDAYPSLIKLNKYWIDKDANPVKEHDGFRVYKFAIVVTGITDKEFDIEDNFPKQYFKYYTDSDSSTKVYGGNQDWQGEDCGSYTVTETANGLKFHVTLTEEPIRHYKIEYQLIVKDNDALNKLQEESGKNTDKKYTWKNTAESGDADSTVDVTYTYDALSKELLNADKINGTNKTASYRITVNPGKKTINGGDPYTLTDTFTHLSVDESSISITTDPAGKSVNYKFKGNVGTFDIPDATKVTITYDARVIGAGSVEISNVAEISGQKKESKTTVNVSSTSGGTSSITSLKLLKYEKDHQEKKLKGAKFALYYVDENDKSEKCLTEDIVTDADGIATIQGTGSSTGWNLHPDTLYYVKEIAAPAGYKVSNEKYYFTIQDEPDHDQNIYYNGDTLAIADELESTTPEKTSIRGVKTWDDGNNQDGLRPENIKVNLLADGKAVDQKTVTPDANGEWKYTFENLPVNKDGKKIEYTVTEEKVEKYETHIDGYNIKNSHTPEKTSISGVKTWDDGNNQDGLRPENIKVNLLADGKAVDQKTVTPDANGEWKYTFENLPVNKDGKKIEYTVTEEKVEKYEAHIDGYNIKNMHTPATTSVLVRKTWDDSNNASGKRPSEIKVKLYADHVFEKEQTLTADASGDWSYEFTDLPMYKEGKVGQKINYTVTEEEIPGYVLTSSESSTKDGKTVVQLTNKSIDFKVNKFERTGTRELDGAKIQIKDSTGAVVAEWISKSGETHDFGSKLKAGETYTIHEETAPSGYYMISDMNFTVGEKGDITLTGSSDDVKLEDGVIKICDERIKSSGGGGDGDHPHPLPETTPAETTPAETTVPETTPVETTTPDGGNGGNHGPSEEVETDEYGRVRGANRGKNKNGQDGGNVKGANRGKTRTGDESMMSIFGFGFLAAVLVLLGWFGIRFTKRNRR